MAAYEKRSFDSKIDEIFTQVRTALEGDTTGLLASASAATDYRARRLAASEARLEERLGTDHPRVADLRGRRQRLEAVERGLRFERRRIEDDRTLRPDEWLATGRVVGETGEPLVGFRILVFDRDRGPKDLLGDELTDDAGEFRAEYHRRDFDDETKSKVPELMLVVFDRDEKLVFETDDAVPANSTRRNRFEIMLTDARLSDGVARGACTATTASGKRCKNSARPGSDLCAVHAKSERTSRPRTASG